MARAFCFDEDGFYEISAGGLAFRVRGDATAIAEISDHVYLSRICAIATIVASVYCYIVIEVRSTILNACSANYGELSVSGDVASYGCLLACLRVVEATGLHG